MRVIEGLKGVLLTKAHVGLSSVDDTADSAKPVSTAQQAAIDEKLAIPAGANDDFLQRKSGLWVNRSLSQVRADLTIALNNLAATVAPTVNEDSGDGYGAGSFWTDVTNDRAYVCLDATVGAAIWRYIAPVPAAVRVSNSAALTVATSTITPLTFDTEAFDTFGYHSTSVNTGRLTVPTGHGGLFSVGLYAGWGPSAGGGRRSFAIRHQGSTVIAAVEQTPDTAATYPTFCFQTLYRAAAGEYFDTYGFHDRGSSLDVLGGYAFWLNREGD